MNMTGRPDEAVKLIERALAMNTPNLGWALRIACEAHLLAGQAEQAIATCEKATGTSIYWYIHLFLAAAYANNGDMDKAAAAKAEIFGPCRATRSPNCAPSVIRITRST